MTLLHLSPPDRALPPALAECPGGFAWWYVDILDHEGNGLVLIWSFGLPFLPGYLAAARDGAPELPAQRPSLNLALYRRGRLAYYQLQEYAPDSCSWDGEEQRFGRSVLRSSVRDGQRVMEAEICCDVPGGSETLQGVVRLEGPARRGTDEATPSTLHTHDWSPLVGPARGQARFNLDGSSYFRLDGRGYHDRNGSASPFDRLNIHHWIWGRAPFEDREVIFYLLWPRGGGPPELHGLEIDERGFTYRSRLEARLSRKRRAVFGMPFWREVELRREGSPWLRVSLDNNVDDGPFYLRFSGRAEDRRGDTAPACVELVRPDRVDIGYQRPFVRMRVDQTAGSNSVLMPLFAGPGGGSLWRLARRLGGEVAPRLPLRARVQGEIV